MKRKLKVKVFRGILRKTRTAMHLDIPRQLTRPPNGGYAADPRVRCVATIQLSDTVMFIRGSNDFYQEAYDSQNDMRKRLRTMSCEGWSRRRVDKVWNEHKKSLRAAAKWVATEFETKMKGKHG